MQQHSSDASMALPTDEGLHLTYTWPASLHNLHDTPKVQVLIEKQQFR
jgi:hypothetical protein